MTNMWSEVEAGSYCGLLYILILQHHAGRQRGPVKESEGYTWSNLGHAHHHYEYIFRCNDVSPIAADA